MLALWGAALTAGGVLVTALAALYLRSPDAPRWTRAELVAELIAVILTAMIGLGVGYMLMGGFHFARVGVDPVELAAVIGCFAVAFVLWRVIAPGQRLRAQKAAAPPGNVVELDPAPTTPTPPTPRPVTRKAA